MPMLRTSSEAFPASKKVMSDIPYVLRVEFGDLAHEVPKIIGKPIACQKCGGFLVSTDQIKEDDKVGKHFICSFCSTLNVIEGEIVVAGDETDFMVEPPLQDTESTTTGESPVGGSFLALIDVSGSMAGANLAAVKRSLTNSIDSLAANTPDTLFGLIEFESSVKCRNLENGKAIELPRTAFASLDDIESATKRILDDVKLVRVGENSEQLKKHVSALRDQGGTALGPAVAMASVITKHRNVARVVLLTDGLANEGIGALEGFQVTPADSFYQQVGERFKEFGAAVDVVGIASGAGMELKTLGLMPEATGGQMYYVTPNELDRSISELAGSRLLGRDVEVSVITPEGVRVKDASGVSRSVVEEIIKQKKSKIGVVGENHELYFEVEPDSKIERSEIPIQVQVAYTDEEGARRIRSVTSHLKVTEEADEIVKSLDPTIGATFVTQKAGEEAFSDGNKGRERGISRIESFRKAISTKANQAPKSGQAKFKKAEQALAAEGAEMQRVQEMMKAAPEGAPSAAADEAFTKGLAQMKRSSKQLFDEDEE